MSEERESRIDAFRKRKPIEELERKARKAVRRQNIWTVEELDWIAAEARAMSERLRGCWS